MQFKKAQYPILGPDLGWEGSRVVKRDRTQLTLPLVGIINRIRFGIKTRLKVGPVFICNVELCLKLQKVDKGDSTCHKAKSVTSQYCYIYLYQLSATSNINYGELRPTSTSHIKTGFTFIT